MRVGIMSSDKLREKHFDDTYAFQFLIGTLKTELRNDGAGRLFQVSIPHRYAKNSNKTLFLPILASSFNSS